MVTSCTRWFFFVFLVVVFSVSSAAEDRSVPAAHTLSGQVLDQAGRPVAGATVRLMSRESVLREQESSSVGQFFLSGLAAGRYTVQAADGQRTSPPIIVEADEAKTTHVVLRFGEAAAASPGSKPAMNTEASTPGELTSEIELLKQRLAELQAQVERLEAAERGEKAQGEALRASRLSSSRTGLYGPAAEEGKRSALTDAEQRRQEEKPVPGRGRTEKGLYHGLAAGPPEERYGRSLFGEKVQIGGYGSFRFETNNLDMGPQVDDLPVAQTSFDSFDFRRFVMTLDASPSDRLRVYTEIEYERLAAIEIERTAIPENRGRANRDRQGVRFIQELEGQGGSELAVEQAWAQYDFTDWLGLRAGVIVPPLGRFNILHDDDYWDIPRRTLVDRGGPVIPVKSAWSELGAGLLGNVPFGEGYIDYQFYVMNGARLDFALEEVAALREGRNLVELEPEIAFFSGPFNGTDNADAVSWRVAFSPRLGNEIALSGYHGQYTPDYLRTDSSIHAVGVDGKLTVRRFEVEGEFVYTDFGQMEQVLGELAQRAVDAVAKTSSAETADLETEIEGGFAGPLTNQRYGFWIDFKYRLWPRFLDSGPLAFLGRDFENPQLIPIFRFERIWFNDMVTGFDFSDGIITELATENLEQQRTTLGLTYRPITSVAFSAAWEHNRRVNGSQLIFPDLLGLDRRPDKSFDTFITGIAFGF